MEILEEMKCVEFVTISEKYEKEPSKFSFHGNKTWDEQRRSILCLQIRWKRNDIW